MGKAIMRVQFDVIRHALGLPDDVRIVAAAQAFDDVCDDRLCMRLEGERLPDIKPECRLPEVRAVFQGFESTDDQGPEGSKLRRHGRYYTCDNG